MSLYDNYIPKNATMSYDKFKKLESKQKAIQNKYESEIKSELYKYTIFTKNGDPFTADNFGELIEMVYFKEQKEAVAVFESIIRGVTHLIQISYPSFDPDDMINILNTPYKSITRDELRFLYNDIKVVGKTVDKIDNPKLIGWLSNDEYPVFFISEPDDLKQLAEYQWEYDYNESKLV